MLYVGFNMRYDEMMKRAKEFFDTIDFTPFLPKDETVLLRDVMDAIEIYYDEQHPELLPEDFKRCFFNFTSEDEFAEYLHDRYGIKNREEVVEHIYIWR